MSFFNINKCFSFRQEITTSLSPLSSFSCSEVLINNTGTNGIYVYSEAPNGLDNAFYIGADQVITLKGITNSYNLSARTENGSDVIFVRTAYFSNMPQR